jgi:hypothetical protein
MRSLLNSIFLLLIFISCGNSNDNNESKGIKENLNKSNQYSKQNKADAIVFQRKREPKENAFSILVPKDWQIEGGIHRVNPIESGPSNAIAAKLDFAIKKDNVGSVMIRWLPDVLYFDARYSPAGQMGLFPEGSNYQGMTVLNLMSAENFITSIAFPYAHPNANNVQIIEKKKLTNVANSYGKRVKLAMPYSTMSYDVSIAKMTYTENGNQFEELMVSIIENWGQLGAGMWGNKETLLIRAPIGKLTDWEPVFSVVQNSIKINLQWLVGEIQGQAIRGEIAAKTQKEVEKIGREINTHRQKTNAEIHNDMYLTMTEQEEYMNPYTNEVEVGTNQWQYRWVNESGDIIYTDNEDYDPTTDVNLNRNDFKRSKIRKRFPN